MKKYIALGLVLAMMSVGTACKNNNKTEQTELTETIATTAMTEATEMTEILSTNEHGQIVDANGNVIETQVVTDENGNTKTVDNQGNEIVKNNDGTVIRKTAATQSQTVVQNNDNNDVAQNDGTVSNNTSAPVAQNNNQQTQKTANNITKQQATKQQTATNATTAPVNLGTVHLDENPFATKATTAATTTKATTKATTTTRKSNRYYICNGCGYKTPVANGTSPMSAHMEKQMVAGNMKCSGYHTGTVN